MPVQLKIPMFALIVLALFVGVMMFMASPVYAQAPVTIDQQTVQVAVDVLTVPAITGLVFIILESFGTYVDSKAKPPLALILGASWSVAAFVLMPGSYPNALAAVAVGIIAGAGASGIASYRTTYSDRPPA